MSATMTPPATLGAQPETAAEPPRLVAAPAPINFEPEVAPTRPGQVSASTRRLRNGLFMAIWAPAMVVVSTVGAAVLAVSLPVLAARVAYRERRYR
jgi:hypothetical protein